MPNDTKEPPKKTYRFFEPKNDEFFRRIAEAYSESYINHIIDVADVIATDKLYIAVPFTAKNENFLRNYKENLPFRGCNIIAKIGCKGKNRKCGKGDICAVITSRQSELLAEAVISATEKLEAAQTVRATIINKVKCNCLCLTGVETFDVEDEAGNFLERYITRINSKPKLHKKNTEKLVFACAKDNSNYTMISKNVTEMPLEACNEYQKL